MNLYSQNDIDSIQAHQLPDGNISVLYKPIMETLYYSPGVNISEDDKNVIIHIIRCQIKEQCDVQVHAKKSQSGELEIEIIRPKKPVVAMFKDGIRNVFP